MSTSQIPAIDYSKLAAAMMALQQPAAADVAPVNVAPVNPAAIGTLALSQDAIMTARADGLKAVEWLDGVSAKSEDVNQLIGKKLSVHAAAGTLAAFADSFISGLGSEQFKHLAKATRSQYKSYMLKIAEVGAGILPHLVIPSGMHKGEYYSLQKLYKKLNALDAPQGDKIPEWLQVNTQVLTELNGLLANMAKDSAFNKAPLLAYKTGLELSANSLFELIEKHRPKTEAEKATAAKAKEAEKATAAKAKAKTAKAK